MKKLEVDVLSEATNAAVVRMPDRRFPGLVVQGDKLIDLNAQAKELCEAVKDCGDERVIRLANNLQYDVSQMLDAYAAACNAAENKR